MVAGEKLSCTELKVYLMWLDSFVNLIVETSN